jgi:hypothetical protein
MSVQRSPPVPALEHPPMLVPLFGRRLPTMSRLDEHSRASIWHRIMSSLPWSCWARQRLSCAPSQRRRLPNAPRRWRRKTATSPALPLGGHPWMALLNSSSSFMSSVRFATSLSRCRAVPPSSHSSISSSPPPSLLIARDGNTLARATTSNHFIRAQLTAASQPSDGIGPTSTGYAFASVYVRAS